MRLRKKLLLLAALTALATGRARRDGSDRAGRCPASDLHMVGGQDGQPAQQPGRADHDAEPLARSDGHDRLQDRRHAGLRGWVRSVRGGRKLRHQGQHAGTLATHLFLNSTNLHESATFTYSRDITASSCDSFDVVNTVDVHRRRSAEPVRN